MKKIGLICLMFTALATFGVQAQGSDTVETWRCYGLRDFDKNSVLVELTRVTAAGETQGFGQISVAGVTHHALFRITGFDRRWDFGKDLKYAFIIKPDGRGAYYDFSLLEEGETTKPNELYDCVSP